MLLSYSSGRSYHNYHSWASMAKWWSHAGAQIQWASPPPVRLGSVLRNLCVTVDFRRWIPVGFPVLKRGPCVCTQVWVWACVCIYISAVCTNGCVCVSHNEVLAISHVEGFLLSAHFHFGLVNRLPFKEELSIALSIIKVLGLSAHPPHLSAVLE